MYTDLEFERTAPCSGIDWNYRMLSPGIYQFDLPHSTIGGHFKNGWFELIPTYGLGGEENVTAIAVPGYAWDGASCVPDLPGVLEATGIHDPVYQFADAIAAAWGWKVKRVLALGDMLFNLVMAYNKVNPIIRRIYYAGVSVFGYAFNRVNAWRKK